MWILLFRFCQDIGEKIIGYCTAIGNSGHSLNQDDATLTIWLKGVSDSKSKPERTSGILSSENLPMSKPLHQKINKRILRLEFAEIAPLAFMPDGDTQVRFDPGAFYKSVYQYVCLHIEKKYGTVIPIPRKKSLKTLSAYRVLLAQGRSSRYIKGISI